MQKGIEEGMQKGIEKGIEEGMQKGIEKGIEKVAVNALNKGLSVEDIIDLTGYIYIPNRCQMKRLRAWLRRRDLLPGQVCHPIAIKPSISMAVSGNPPCSEIIDPRIL